MIVSSVPYSFTYDLAELTEHGKDLVLSPNESERAAIADWLGAVAVESFSAALRLKRIGTDHYEYSATFAVDVVQSCVVTLEPVRSHVEGSVSREYRIMDRPARRSALPARSVEISAASDEDTDYLESPVIDLAAPVLEELSLTMDPYPRSQGAKFETASEEQVALASPFAALGALKERMGQGAEKPPDRTTQPSRKSQEKSGKAPRRRK